MNLIELDRAELLDINGGGPTWNWTGKIIGAILDLVEDICDSYATTPEGQAVQQALVDFSKYFV
jgi:hypothetical protein